MRSGSIWRHTSFLTVAGAAAFWLANLLISLTPVASDYRDQLSISYAPMLVQALVGGLIAGLVVSYPLVRFYQRIPTSNAIGKALLLTLITLVGATLLLEVPAKFLGSVDDRARLFLIALAFNTVRFLALGLAIGYLEDRGHTRLGTWRQAR